ncbi:Oidioi.mRNA.OKI2018_I69.XSR.g16472.t1.cds [Oikopleura dioica]|uniref:Oidioi.mRNA.OKI2018_I69.XSR.g16472.t1.cds n=1 Tax=Oikopleura dioica TaxID=34765 RepID=A0ABN7SG68_OIKDI|nr:Oidioi.mRNA.OKI2018_I69.XSR.g16472.t1.cds [Oikopleura dioica]
MKLFLSLFSFLTFVSAGGFDFGFLKPEQMRPKSPVQLKSVENAHQRLEKLCDHLRRFNAAHLISHKGFFDNVFKINRICGKMMNKLSRKCADLTWPRPLEKTSRTRREENLNKDESRHSTDPYENPMEQLHKSGRNLFDWITAHLGECPNAEGHRRRIQLRIVDRFSRQFSKLQDENFQL